MGPLNGYSPQRLEFGHPLLTLKLLQTCMNWISSAEHKGRYFEERLEPNSCLVPLTSIWKSMVAKFQSFFKISSFVFSSRKKLIQVCSNLRVSKWWKNFYFWVEYPFKIELAALAQKEYTCFVSLRASCLWVGWRWPH